MIILQHGNFRTLKLHVLSKGLCFKMGLDLLNDS